MKIIIDFKNITEFETPRLQAKKLWLSHFCSILPMYQNEEVMKTLGGVISEETAKERLLKNLTGWDENGFGEWIWFDNQNKVVGRAGLRKLKLDEVEVIEVGYKLFPQFWGKGFATEMALASIEIVLSTLCRLSTIRYTCPIN